MSSFCEPAARAATVTRIQALQPDAHAAWGSMTAPRMLAHCADAMRMAYGDLPTKAKHVAIARNPIVKWLIFNVIPLPKGSPTAKELLSRPPAEWGDERNDVIALVERFASEMGRGAWPTHPLFGPLTEAEWGKIAWKHMDHHLRQFGV